MGNHGAKSFGLESAPDTLETSISGLVRLVSDTQLPFSVIRVIFEAHFERLQIDESTRESHSGKFTSFDGTVLPW